MDKNGHVSDEMALQERDALSFANLEDMILIRIRYAQNPVTTRCHLNIKSKSTKLMASETRVRVRWSGKRRTREMQRMPVISKRMALPP